MEAQSYTAEERRAANQVWAAAGAYGFEPLFLARNTDGTIDFYMNRVQARPCISGSLSDGDTGISVSIDILLSSYVWYPLCLFYI